MCTYRIVQVVPERENRPYRVQKKKSLFWGLLTWWQYTYEMTFSDTRRELFFYSIEDAQRSIDEACRKEKINSFKPLIISTTTCQTQPK